MNRLLSFLAVVGIAVLLMSPPARSEELTTEDYVQFWKPLEGSWNTITESEGKALPGTWKGRLSPIRTCYVVHGRDGGYPPLYSVDGYNPVTKKWTVAGFDADGAFYMSTLEFADMKKGKRLAKGVIGKGERKLFKKDGTTTTITSTVSCLECSNNRVVLLWSDRKENGQPKPDVKWTCERQRAAKPGPGYEHLKFLEPLAGNWRMEHLADGKKTEGELHAKWAHRKSSLIWSARSWPLDDRSDVTHIAGIITWDAAEQRVREFATFSDGTLATAYFEEKDGKLVITRSGVLADGTKFTTQPVGVCSGDRWEFEPSTWTTPEGEIIQKIGAGVFQRIAKPERSTR